MHLILAREESRRGRQEPPQSCLPPSSWSTSVVLCWAPSRGAGCNPMSTPGQGGGPPTSRLSGRAGKQLQQCQGSLGSWWEEPGAQWGWGKGTRVGEPSAKCRGHWCGGSPRKAGSRRPGFGPGWVGSVAFVETPVGSENVAVKLGAGFSIHFSQSSPAC